MSVNLVVVCVIVLIKPLVECFACLAETQYVQRHNSVAHLLHRVICSHYGFPTCENPVPQSVIALKDVKILWDFEVRQIMSFQHRYYCIRL